MIEHPNEYESETVTLRAEIKRLREQLERAEARIEAFRQAWYGIVGYPGHKHNAEVNDDCNS
jgi:hypothetical protein